jgi:opacity protein-like surface antigen
MSGKKAIIAAVALALGIAAQAAAQDEPNELTGMIGRIFISDQGIQGPNAPTINPFVRSGNGLTFEVNYSRRLLRNPIFELSGEVLGTVNLDEDLNSGGDVVPSNYKQYFLTPGVRLNLFPSTVLSPWVSIGGGFAHFSESKNLNYYGPNPGGSTNSGVLEAGLGVDLNPFERRARHLGFRGEVRDFWSGEPDFPLADTGKTRQHNYFVAGGVVWHF